ncbi:MAG: hypothetical protein IIA83_05650 [Thaumarchaeota archaeon]|nr:hypothetical protein [Nitrososphaerota archaeon]
MTQSFCGSCGWTLENATKRCVHCGEPIKTPPKMGAFEKALIGKRTPNAGIERYLEIIIVIFVTVVILVGSYYISDSFEQSSGKSFGMAVTDFTAILVAAFLVLIIPALIVLGLLKRDRGLSSKSLKNILKGLGLLFLGLIVIVIVSSFFYSDEEDAQIQKERENAEFSARTQAAMKEKMAQMEREKAEFESATVPSGSLGFEKLKYRPYWLVGDEWDEKERTGKIVKSQDCVNAVTMINDNLGSIQKTFYKAWLTDCVR